MSADEPRDETLELLAGEEPGDEISRALQELGKTGTLTVRVYRFNETGTVRDWEMCARVAGSEFDPWTVVENFGAGRYRFEFVLDGRMRKRVERRFAAPKTLESASRQQTPAAAPVPGSDVLSLLLERMKASEAFSQQLVLAMIQNLGKSGGGGISAGDLLAAIREGREQASATVPAQLPHETIIQAIQTGLDLASRIEPTDGGGSVLREFGPKILELVGEVVRRTPVSSPASPRTVQPAAASIEAPTPAPAPALPAAPSSPTEAAGASSSANPALGASMNGAGMLTAFLRSRKAQLLEDAGKKRNGYMLGAFFAERVPDAYLGPLHDLATAEPEVRRAVLRDADPELEAIAPWFEDVARGVADSIATEDEETEESENAPGPTSHVPDRHDSGR